MNPQQAYLRIVSGEDMSADRPALSPTAGAFPAVPTAGQSDL